MTAPRCDACGATVDVFCYEREATWLCGDCMLGPEPRACDADASPLPSSVRDVDLVPRSSSLVPCLSEARDRSAKRATDDDGPEVEWLLQHEGKYVGGEYVDPILVEPVTVELPALPDDATPTMRAVADFYKRVRGLRLWASDDRDVPFAARWVAAKLGLSKDAANRALRQLVACGVLQPGEPLPGRGQRGTRTFAPGTLPAAGVVVDLAERRRRRAS